MSPAPSRLWDYEADVDSIGRFVIEDAPPGQFKCVLYNHNGIPGHSAGVEIQPGATARVVIGGNGSTVTGRLKPANTNRIDWLRPVVARLEAELPPGPNFGVAQDAATLRRKAEFWMSRAGLERSRANQMYPIEVDANGQFRVHDVPRGSYRMVVVFSNAWLSTNVSIAAEPSTDLGELAIR